MDEPVRTLADTIGAMKTLPRAGWLRCGVEDAACESVAEHTFGVAALALLFPGAAKLGLDRDRCVALAIVHDLAESVVGDITPHDGVEPAEKRRREESAIRELALKLGNESLIDLWLEFEAGETPEARLVRELDGIEMAMQAVAYRRGGMLSKEDAAVFIDSARARAISNAGRDLLAAVTNERLRSPDEKP